MFQNKLTPTEQIILVNVMKNIACVFLMSCMLLSEVGLPNITVY